MKKVFNIKNEYGNRHYNSIGVVKILRDIMRDRGYEVRTEWLQKEITRKGSIEADIRENAVNGMVAIAQWGRDCDMAEGTSAYLIPANIRAYLDHEQGMYENAEGPCSQWVLSPQEYAEFTPSFRDRALEAFEDGHPHVIY